MIGFIKGKIIDISPSKVIVETDSGIGYIVNSTASCLSNKHIGKQVELWTHTAVRETDISIYGFDNKDELGMFEKLLTVSGIGPKSALTIIGVAGIKNLEDAIISGNTAILTKVAGVGKKTADKIVLELNGKIVSKELDSATQENLDVLEALSALGYKEHQVKDILRELPENLSNINEKIKEALKIIGKK